MASITVRNLEESLERRLRVRAAENGRSIEQETHSILRAALDRGTPPPEDLASAIHARFAPLGGVDLDLPPRESIRAPRLH